MAYVEDFCALMIDAGQLREYVIDPTLRQIGLWSQNASSLLLGTAMVESGLTYLHQIGGPALGLWQMELATHDDLWENFLPGRRQLEALVQALKGWPLDSGLNLVGNLPYACAMARVLYFRVPAPLPSDATEMAKYWKAHYNTPEGAGNYWKAIATFQKAIET